MCGIVGYIGPQACADILVDGLRRLEYRGYDSAGLAVHDGKKVDVVRAVGKLSNLVSALREHPLPGTIGIGHTRWATHGRPTEVNAHPHVAGNIALVHNGIIENHLELKRQLAEQGVKFLSDTDTEIVAHLVDRESKAGNDLLTSVRRALAQVHGAYAVAVIDEKHDRIVVAKNASPLVIGFGDGEMFAASDIPAILPYTKRMLPLEEGEIGVLTREGLELMTMDGTPVDRKPRTITWNAAQAEKGGYKHFMLKEIHEQPRAIEDTLRGRIDLAAGDVIEAEIGVSAETAKSIKRVYFIACGTSNHASLYGRFLMESLAKVEATTELASEFIGRDPIIGPDDLVIAVSQSGETLDTLAALKVAKEKGAKLLAIEPQLIEVAGVVAKARDVLYLGRGTAYPIAMEGALKLKELSYIHAEGYAAGEMKHGPIALIDDAVPIVVVAPPDDLFEKTASNVQETLARGGRVVMLSDAAGIARFGDRLAGSVVIPEIHPFAAPVLYSLPVQLLAYHVAVLKGTDVDQPRNLAKSVVVE